jgi:Ca2+-binding EF-hand superfamily protein
MAAFGAKPPRRQSRLVFDKYDSTGNGKVTKAEFHDLCWGLGHYLDEETFEAAWCEVETEGTGELTFEEFIVWWREDDRWGHLQLTELQLTNMATVHEYFRWFDAEGDGELTHDEFVQLHRYMLESGFEVGDAEEILEEVDTSKNGTVDYNEFVVWMCGVGCLDNANIQVVAQRHHEKALVRRASGLSLAEQLAQEQEQASLSAQYL